MEPIDIDLDIPDDAASAVQFYVDARIAYADGLRANRDAEWMGARERDVAEAARLRAIAWRR
jgi:hypothetical protein